MRAIVIRVPESIDLATIIPGTSNTHPTGKPSLSSPSLGFCHFTATN